MSNARPVRSPGMPAPQAGSAVLLLTMPGFGCETLRRLAAMPVWAGLNVTVALVGQRPAAWRRAAAGLRRACSRRSDRVHRLADGTLCARDAERLLQSLGLRWGWVADDAEVQALRAQLRPQLTLTLTSRILFSAHTLQAPAGRWLNVHPGLLPEYAGASPAPYMFFDGVGGCTIHVMAARVDAGAVIDRAPMSGALGDDVGEYFFERLPVHTADRMAVLLEAWLQGGDLAPLAVLPQALRHCSSARLAADRRLHWHQPPERLARWVASLAAIAPPYWLDSRQRRIEVMAAERVPGPCAAPPGTVLRVAGRLVEVACTGGAVALRCRWPARAVVGQVLPSPPPRSVA